MLVFIYSTHAKLLFFYQPSNFENATEILTSLNDHFYHSFKTFLKNNKFLLQKQRNHSDKLSVS